jgi:hypothetical protein
MQAQPPPRRDATYSRKDRLYSEKLAPNKNEFRLSKTSLLWIKRLVIVVGVAIAVATTLAFLGVFDKDTLAPPLDNPKLDQAIKENFSK